MIAQRLQLACGDAYVLRFAERLTGRRLSALGSSGLARTTCKSSTGLPGQSLANVEPESIISCGGRR